MKKFVFIEILLGLGLLALIGCKTKVDKTPNPDKTPNSDFTIFDKFTIIETRVEPNGNEMYIMYDNDTKVEYYYIYYTTIDNQRGGLCPIYNADGTVKVYTENSD